VLLEVADDRLHVETRELLGDAGTGVLEHGGVDVERHEAAQRSSVTQCA
jgi:hypothetical protein